ncbi:ABC transporter permease [Natranaerovirga hydrolytica]|nr:ABC transporter permease [Natranaerovirga hydrolytica]
MKRNYQVIKYLFLQFIKKDYKTLVILVIVLWVSFMSIFALILSLRTQQESIGELESLKRTYTFRFQSNKDLEILLQGLFDLDITIIKSKRENVGLNFRNQQFRRVTLEYPDEWHFLNNKTLQYNITQGRFFTQSELEQGEKVIILNNRDYHHFFSDILLGDTIRIGNHEYHLIGLYESNNPTIGSIVPYKGISELSSESNIIKLYSIQLLLDAPLSSGSEKELVQLIKTETGNEISIISMYDDTKGFMTPYRIVYLFFMALILFFCAFNIRKLIKIMTIQKKYMYTLFRRLGMSINIWRITCFITVECIILFSCILSIILYKIIKDYILQIGFVSNLYIKDYLVLYLCTNFILYFSSFKNLELVRTIFKKLQIGDYSDS